MKLKIVHYLKRNSKQQCQTSFYERNGNDLLVLYVLSTKPCTKNHHDHSNLFIYSSNHRNNKRNNPFKSM